MLVPLGLVGTAQTVEKMECIPIVFIGTHIHIHIWIDVKTTQLPKMSFPIALRTASSFPESDSFEAIDFLRGLGERLLALGFSTMGSSV